MPVTVASAAVRVVVVSAWEPWRTTDGAAFVLDHHLAELAPRHEITLLAAGAPAAESPLPPEAVDRWPLVAARWFGSGGGPAVDHLRRRVASTRDREPAHVRYVERRRLLEALDEALASGVDVVHLHGWGTARLVDRTGATPAVHMAIDPWAGNVTNRRRHPLRRLIDRPERRWIERHEAKHYPELATVAVVTARDAEVVRAIAPEAEVEVVPNGVEPGAQPTPVASGPPVLGFHGVFDSQANVDAARVLVTEILPRVREQVPDTGVRLVGRRPPPEVRGLAGDHVELLVDAPDLRAVLEPVTVHVDWMTSGAGIKNKVLEAMAAARPVVSSPLGAEGIGAGPGLVVATDVDAAAAEIAALLTDRAAARAAGKAGRERVLRDFSWERSAAGIEQLWERAQTAKRRTTQ
jgi:glycosyltransferase involved in cell wall biosynthesis